MLVVMEMMGVQWGFAYGGNLSLGEEDEAWLCVTGSSARGHTSGHKILSKQWHTLG